MNKRAPRTLKPIAHKNDPAPAPAPDQGEPQMAEVDTTPASTPTPTPSKPEMSIADEIASKVAARSKGFVPDLAVGAASMYDISRYEGDYTAGGQLEGRFVNNEESRVDIMKNRGYDVPSAWSSRLKDLRHGGQILMLRPTDIGEKERAARRSMAHQLSTQSRPEYAPSYGSMKEHVTVSETSHEQITLDPDRVSDQNNKSVLVAD